MTDTQLSEVIKYAVLSATAGAAAFLGSYLKRKGENLATHEDVDKLVRQVSAVTAATKQIEARITRASSVYGRQCNILQKLYRHLYDAQGLFQSMTGAGRTTHEMTPEEYAPMVAKAIEAAREEFLNGRLFIPPALVQQFDGFFDAVFEGQRNFALAHHPMIDPARQAEFWDAAAAVAYQRVPEILGQIDDAARALIHGEAT
jgi:hypothetical protein